MDKTCPFCGNDKLKAYDKIKIARRRENSTYHCYVACEKCHAQGPRILIHATREEMCHNPEVRKEAYRKAFAAWNIRLGNK